MAVRNGIETVKIKERSKEFIDGFIRYINEKYP
jgi:hypothetical protein